MTAEQPLRRPGAGDRRRAPPATPGRSPRSSSGATRGSSWSRRPRARDAGRRLDEPLPALPGAGRARPSSTWRRSRTGRRRASSPTRTGPPPPVVAELRGLGLLRRRPLGRLPAARRRRSTRAGTAPTATPDLLGERGLRASGARPRAGPRGRAGRQPRLLSDRRAARARAAGRRRAGRVESSSTRSPASRAPGATAASACRSSSLTENVAAYAVEGHRHQPEIEQELSASRPVRRRLVRRPRRLRPAPAADRPGAAGELLRVPGARPLGAGARSSCTRGATRASRSSTWSTAPPGVREVRDTNLCRIRVTRIGERRAARLRRDRQPLEGRGRAGDPEPEPDARPRRDRGAGVSGHSSAGHSSPVAIRRSFGRAGSTPPAGVEELDPARLAPGFRAAATACGLKGGGRDRRRAARRARRRRSARRCS